MTQGITNKKARYKEEEKVGEKVNNPRNKNNCLTKQWKKFDAIKEFYIRKKPSCEKEKGEVCSKYC